MANRQTLAVTGYTRPGTYIGQAFNPRVVNTGDFPRIVTFIGKGSDYITADNLEVVRGFITAEQLVFTTVSPFTASLDYASNNKKTPSGSDATKQIKLYNQVGVEVDSKMWAFIESAPGSGAYNKIEVFDAVYNPSDTYSIDYQTANPNVLDTLPIAGVRSINKVGDRRFEDRYDLGEDFLMVTDIEVPVVTEGNPEYSGIVAIDSNYGPRGEITAISAITKASPGVVTSTAHGLETGDKVVLSGISGMTELNGQEVTITSLTSSTFSIGISTSAYGTYTSGGNVGGKNSLIEHDSPTTHLKIGDYVNVSGVTGMTEINGKIGKVVYVNEPDDTVTVDIDSTNYSAYTSGGSLKLAFGISESSYYTGSAKTYTFDVAEVDDDLSNFPQISSPTQISGTGTGTLTLNDAITNFTGVVGRNYEFTVASKTTVSGVTVVGFNYAIKNSTTSSVISSGNYAAGTGVAITSIADAIFELKDGIKVTADDVEDIEVGDVFKFSAEEDTSVSYARITWYSDSYPVTSGTLNLYSNRPLTSVAIEDGLKLNFGESLGLFSSDDQFKVTVTNGDALGNGQISWSLTRSKTQVLSPNDVYYDALGYVTGTPKSYYITLADIPSSVTSVSNTTGTPDHIEGTPYVKVVVDDPTLNLEAEYIYSQRPSLGQTYYVSVKYNRPDSMYNTPLTFISYAEALAQIGYPSSENHLGIMLDYAFNVAGNRIAAVVQVKSENFSGTFNNTDFQNALNAAYSKKDLTDICVLGRNDMIPNLVTDSIRSNDPLYGALRLYWIGFPRNTSISSMRSSALNDLQVPLNSFAHGTFIALANRSAKRTVNLESGSAIQLTLDGSFIAAMLASKNAAFTDPNTVLYNQPLPGIDDIDTFTDTEISLLGQASITYILKNPLTNVATITDAVTTDTTSSDANEINVMVVKQLVTKRIINSANTALIGYVARDVEDGINHVRSVIKNVLITLISEGIISEFTDSNNRPRSLEAADIDVFRSETDYTRYNFTYYFNGRYGIKRLTGLYSVDENIFSATVS